MAKLGQIKSGTMRVGNTTASGYGIVYADEVIGHRRVNTYDELKSLPTWCLYNKAGGDNINTAIGQLWYVFNGNSSHPAGLYQLVNTDISLDSSWKLFKNGADVSTHNTTYKFKDGSDGSFTVKPSDGDEQTVSIGKVADAAHADQADGATTAATAKNADYATKATQDGNGKVIADTYATKSDVSALTHALIYRGTIGTNGTITSPNVPAQVGDVYVAVAGAPAVNGVALEPGDMIIAKTAASGLGTWPTWTAIQTNINGAVTTSSTLSDGKLILGGGGTSVRIASSTGFVKINNGDVSVDNNVVTTSDTILGNGKLVVGGDNKIVKTASGSGFVKLKNGIVEYDLNTYLTSVPVAKDAAVGGFKTGYTQNGKNYAVVLNDKNQAYVYVPWTDNNTTYPLASASTNGLMSKDDKSKLDDLSLSGESFNDILTNTKGLTLNLVGTGSSYNIPIVKPSTDASTYGLMSGADKKKLDGIAEDANKYSLPVANANGLGGIRIGYSPLAGTKNYPVVLDTNNKAYVNVPWTDNNTTYTADGVYVTLTSGQFSLAHNKKTLIDNAVQRSEIGAIPEEAITKLF